MKARIAVAIAATVGCVGLIGGAAYAVTVLEWVMPASNLQLGYAAALEYSSKTAELSALDAQAKATHEPPATTAAPPAVPGSAATSTISRQRFASSPASTVCLP